MTKQTILLSLFLILSQNSSILGQDVYRYPNSSENLDIEANKALIQAELSAENAEQYVLMAKSLWNLEKDADAKKMFLKIFYSQLPYLNQKDYRIANNTKEHYGYGSEIEHSKYAAAISLTQIYINEKDFQEALKYLVKADKAYPKIVNCGTGDRMHTEQLRYLYSLCYEGTGQYDNAIQLLLPYCFSWQNQVLINSLKAKYSQAELKSMILESLKHMDFQLDDSETKVTRTVTHKTGQKTAEEISYISGTGIIELLDVQIQLHKPSLKNGETITKEHFIKEFKETNFYVRLTRDYDDGIIKIIHN